MGKRSNFERKERDFYPTPESAVLPLLKHIDQVRFIEPCVGQMHLVDILEKHGNICVTAMDIAFFHDGWHNRNFDIFVGDATTSPPSDYTFDYYITNPPWDRKILHPLIEKLSSIKPTWLLFDADWMHTKQSVDYMKYCKKIVSVGRVKWFPDSKYTGKDNVCWYLFDRHNVEDTIFYGRSERT